MKKLLSVLLLIAVIIGCVGCASEKGYEGLADKACAAMQKNDFNAWKSITDIDNVQKYAELTGLDFDKDEFFEELQEGFSIQCLESGKTQAQAIQNMWKTNLGVEMPVSVVDFNVLLPMLMEGTFDCVIGGGQDSNYRDPEGFMNFIYEEGKWDDPEFLALMEKVQTQTGDERIQTWMEIERLVLENFIYIPQVYAENNWVFQSNVRGLKIFTYGYEMDFKDVYLVKE